MQIGAWANLCLGLAIGAVIGTGGYYLYSQNVGNVRQHVVDHQRAVTVDDQTVPDRNAVRDQVVKNDYEKPLAPIVGADGNVFNLIGICSRALKTAGYPDKAKEMTDRITSSGSYEEALSIMCEYIEPVDQNYQRLEDINDYDEIDINI